MLPTAGCLTYPPVMPSGKVPLFWPKNMPRSPPRKRLHGRINSRIVIPDYVKPFWVRSGQGWRGRIYKPLRIGWRIWLPNQQAKESWITCSLNGSHNLPRMHRNGSRRWKAGNINNMRCNSSPPAGPWSIRFRLPNGLIVSHLLPVWIPWSVNL